MAELNNNNKRIAKNTIILYFRMVVIMIVSLYTTRVVLKVLGASDYGIYDVVAGVIGMLGYFNTILSGGIARFLTISIGKNDINKTKNTFALCNTVALFGALAVLFLGETFGFWFVDTQLNIPTERHFASIILYQCAIASVVLSLLQMPFSACIIAHEDMSVYGYMAIVDAFLKLAIVYLLTISTFDNLIFYGILLLLTNIIGFIIYWLYSLIKYKETTISLSFERQELSEFLTYSGWTTIGAFAGILNNYGITLLLNIFFGTIVNAARGVSAQINLAVTKIYGTFQTAAKPQIFKYYSQKDISSMSSLICNTSKYSAYLTLLIIIPVGVHLSGILSVWLGSAAPEYTLSFSRCMMIQSLFLSIDLPVGTGIQAVGKMKLPNLTTSFLYLVVFPLTYLAFWLGGSPVMGYIVYISCSPFILLVDLLILRKYIGFSILYYLRHVLFSVSKILILALILPCLIEVITFSGHVLLDTILKLVLSFISVAIIIFYIGLNSDLRKQILKRISQHVG